MAQQAGDITRYGTRALKYGIGADLPAVAPDVPTGFNPEALPPANQGVYNGPVADAESFRPAPPVDAPTGRPAPMGEVDAIKQRIGQMGEAAKLRGAGVGVPPVEAPPVTPTSDWYKAGTSVAQKVGRFALGNIAKGGAAAIATDMVFPHSANANDDTGDIRKWETSGKPRIDAPANPTPGTDEYNTWQNSRNAFFQQDQPDPRNNEAAFRGSQEGAYTPDVPAAQTIGTMSIGGNPAASATIGADGQIQRSDAWQKSRNTAAIANGGVGGSLNVMSSQQDRATSPGYDSTGQIMAGNLPAGATGTGEIPKPKSFDQLYAEAPSSGSGFGDLITAKLMAAKAANNQGVYEHAVGNDLANRKLALEGTVAANTNVHQMGALDVQRQHIAAMTPELLARAGMYQGVEEQRKAQAAHQTFLDSPEGQKQAQLVKGKDTEQMARQAAAQERAAALKAGETDPGKLSDIYQGAYQNYIGNVPVGGVAAVPAQKAAHFWQDDKPAVTGKKPAYVPLDVASTLHGYDGMGNPIFQE
jgi:hypothetical protein